ncbi:MAG: methyltransferase domain-containing protein, partial [Candidatus Hydrogenedentota bacterium]
VLHLVHIYLNTLLNRERCEIRESFIPPNWNQCIKDNQGWDEYWANKNKSALLIYDLIAAFYRKYIIKKSLNYFIMKYFIKDAKILHAGCGSGQVDIDIIGKYSITALDISTEALAIYRKVTKGHCNLLHGSIFAIPEPNATFDGIYNLGVMEHFTEGEINNILNEFNRVLKPNGKIILFWPPEFGISVVFLKFIRHFMNVLFKENIKLHPDEITKIKSKRQVKHLLLKAGFSLIEYYFGPKDLFTHVVVGEKLNKDGCIEK